MFCPKCGSMLMPKKVDGKTVKACSCGYSEGGEMKMSQKSTHEEKKVEIIEKEESVNALTKEDCPKCEHPEAEYWTQQTRSADESPTKFLRCTKCRHTWRDYD